MADRSEGEAARVSTCRVRAAPEIAAQLRTHNSSIIAKILEYQLLGDVGAELLARGKTIEILRSDVDADGYDVVLEANGVLRHIQLKSKVAGGSTRKVSCHTRLAEKPSGCVIWVTYDPLTCKAVEYACFGHSAGQPLPVLGEKVSRRSTRNGKSEQPLRAMHRDLKYNQFRRFTDIMDLVDWLFWDEPASDPAQLNLVKSAFGRICRIDLGSLTLLPMSINITDRLALVIIIDRALVDMPAHFLVVPQEVQEAGTWLTLDLRERSWSSLAEIQSHPLLDELLLKSAGILAEELQVEPSERSVR